LGDQKKSHFAPEEFACPCCGRSEVKPELVERLNAAREIFGKPMTVSSGFRCERHNRAVGGKPDSAHLAGEAADLVFQSGADMFAAYDALKRAGFTRLGVGNHFIHVDIANSLPRPALWGYGG